MKIKVFKSTKKEWTFCPIPVVILDNDYCNTRIIFVWILWAIMLSFKKNV